MKSNKITAQEVLDSFLKEYNQDDMNEVYKAMICYSLNISEINEKIENELENVIDYYFDNDYIPSFINNEIREYAISRLEEEKDELL